MTSFYIKLSLVLLLSNYKQNKVSDFFCTRPYYLVCMMHQQKDLHNLALRSTQIFHEEDQTSTIKKHYFAPKKDTITKYIKLRLKKKDEDELLRSHSSQKKGL